MKSNLVKLTIFLPILSLLAGSVSVQAQDENGFITVREVNVKADGMSDWIDLQRRSKEALEKIGGPGRSVWQEIRGDNYIFHIVQSHDSWSFYDTPAERGMDAGELALWGRDLQASLRARQIITYRTFDDLDIDPAEGSEPNLVALRKFTVKPGQAAAFQAWLRETLVPAIRKAGATGRSFGRVPALS